MFKRLSVLMPVLCRLGLSNVATVALYRFALRSGLLEKLLPLGSSYEGVLFHSSTVYRRLPQEIPSGDSVVQSGEGLLRGEIPYFSHRKFNVGSPPAWFQNPVNNRSCTNPRQHWSSIPDFDPEIEDIKTIWELSRFDWALIFARAFCRSGEVRFLRALNEWSVDWIKQNPLNMGPNWKCGQEAGIRLIQVLLAAFLLKQHQKPTDNLVRFVLEHCSRIEPTIRYAIAQNNNHGTSEAAALFIGGAWLEKFSGNSRFRQMGIRWKQKGRRWLENRVKKLVAEDGSFSQYSVNYHRLLVDTLNIVEFWRRELKLEKFSELFLERCRAAVLWLYQMVDTKSGDAPNMGSNDGARLFVLSNTNYRDFRPSVQLGAVLFLGGKVYPEGFWDESLFWLRLIDSHPTTLGFSKKTLQFPEGGYVVLQGEGEAWGVLRYPVFRFRPSHADAFHFDLWHRGINVLRDSGTFSYNTRPPWQSYFSSTRAHNTVEFDARDQMPSLSRFLRGSWLEMDTIGGLEFPNEKTSWSGSYCDKWGCRHKRTIINDGETWKIIDEIDGFKSSAVLRWRLVPGVWKISGFKCFGESGEIKVSGTVPINRFELVDGWESRYYFHKSRLPVLEVEIQSAKAVLTSEIRLKS